MPYVKAKKKYDWIEADGKHVDYWRWCGRTCDCEAVGCETWDEYDFD